MKVDPSHHGLDRYPSQGYAILGGRLPQRFVDDIAVELDELVRAPSPGCFMEEDGVTPRSIYGLHMKGATWRELSRWKPLVVAVEHLIGAAYVYQYKASIKIASRGDGWDWHTDFIYWHLEDGMPTDSALTAAIFIDEVTRENGPIELIPGSNTITNIPHETTSPEVITDDDEMHRQLYAKRRSKYTISDSVVNDLRQRLGLVQLTGPKGTIALFAASTVHGSAANCSSQNRSIVLITYNALANQPDPGTPRRSEILVNHYPAANYSDSGTE